ncbi:hypothetical protein U6B65_01425 [Oscillospiraceae bacterium MB08-C2-2]|nr:hypothetical protein U6B65_01425 [Oscillospiraceae bacterium MB08-C2-2]
MQLYINGQTATVGMKAQTFRGEPVTLISWSEPGSRSGGNGGRVYVEEKGGIRCEYFPSVIGGKFMTEEQKMEENEAL